MASAKFHDGQTVRDVVRIRHRSGGVTRDVSLATMRPRSASFELEWEASGDWTDVDELEMEFWEWLGTVPSVRVRSYGDTLSGRRLRAAILGNPQGATFFLAGGVHGREPAGREVALMVLRDMASGVYDWLLDSHRVVVMPTVNPDGRADNTRGNTEDVDINRDSWMLESAEARAVAGVLADFPPVMLIDLHQYNGDGVHHFWPQSNPRVNTVTEIQVLADAARDGALSEVEGLGFASTPYPLARRGTLNESATFRHCVGLLAETRARDFVRADVMQILRTVADYWLEFFEDNSAALEAAQAASIDDALTSPGPEVVNLEQVDLKPENETTISISGYDLDEPLPQIYVDAFGIEVQGSFVPIDQKARGILPEILDPDSLYRVVDATRRA